MGTQHLPHEDANTDTQGVEHNTGQIKQGGGNIHGRYHIQTAGGVALIHNSNTQRPQGFVDQQGGAGDGDGFEQPAGDVQGAIRAPDEGMPVIVAVAPDGNQQKFCVPGDDRGQCRAPHTHGGSAKVAENENIVERQVDKNRADAGNHGDKGFFALFQGAGVGVGDTEGEQTPQHNGQIVTTIAEYLSGILGVAVSCEVQVDQRILEKEKQSPGDQGNGQTDQHFKPEGIADAVIIPAAVKLGGKNTRTGGSAENAEIKNKDDLVDNGHAAHRKRANLTDHDVVKQGYKIGDSVLDDNGNGNLENPSVEGTVANIL